MYNFIKLQYKLGRITDAQVLAFTPRWITEAEAAEILASAPKEGQNDRN